MNGSSNINYFRIKTFKRKIFVDSIDEMFYCNVLVSTRYFVVFSTETMHFDFKFVVPTNSTVHTNTGRRGKVEMIFSFPFQVFDRNIKTEWNINE